MRGRGAAGAGFALIAAALVAACSDEAPTVAEGGEQIACALGGGAGFTPVCAVDRAQVDGHGVLVVRHPDGGFRRFAVLADGRGLAAADGAEVAQVAVAEKLLEVRVGEDRYRFPFTVKRDAAAPE